MIDIDTLIFVGFDSPKDDEAHGERTLTRIMNATGVKKENIYFYGADQTNPMGIVRNSFVMDKSQPNNYRIGNSLCIASSSLKTKRKEVEKLGRIGIQVRTGYQHVDLSKMSESEIAHWIESGKYTPDVSSSNEEGESSSAEDLLADILGGDTAENTSTVKEMKSPEEVSATPDPELTSAPDPAPEPNPTAETDPTPDPEPSILDQIDALDDDQETGSSVVSTPEPETTSDEPRSEERQETVVEQRAEPEEEEIIYEGELVPTEEETLTGSSSVYGGGSDEQTSSLNELDDILSGLDKPGKPRNEDSYSGISPEQMGVENPEKRNDTGDKEYSSTFDHQEDRYTTADDLRDPEAYRRERGIEESSPMEEDSMEIINQMSSRRKESIQQQEKRRQQDRQAAANSGDNSPLSQLEAMVGGKKRAQQMERDDQEAHRLDVQSRERSEENMREDGSRKNYREYLSERGQTEQKVEEKIRSDFGNTEEFTGGEVHSENGEDNTYVTKGVGRIILCTAGKGGVGKTLVSIGMASALSLARAYEAKTNPGYTPGRTWLIESDYNSPKLAAAFGTRRKHIGNLAAILDKSSNASLGNDEVRQCIEDNIYRDPETGVNVLACPPLSMNSTSTSIPMAILMAISYASRQGDDVIVDHGNLTVGEYSSLDKILAKKTAHRVVVVGNMGCIDQTRTALDVLASSVPGSSEKPRNPHSISVVLNKSRSEQYYVAQDKLKPFRIIATIPPIDALREENSVTGDTYLNNAPQEVKKAIYDRCGIMLTRLGFSSLQNYFVAKPSYSNAPRRGRKNVFRRLAERVSGDKG